MSRLLDVLYVDDDDDMRALVAGALAKDMWITSRMAAHAADALRLLVEAPLPDVALIDVAMPGIDGPTLVAALRAAPRTRDLPIIFLTARPDDPRLAEGLRTAGTIAKPFDPETLARDIRRLLRPASAA